MEFVHVAGGLFQEAENFMADYEKFSAKLMHFIQHRDNSLFILYDKGKIQGIVFYGRKTATCCFCNITDKILESCTDFFKNRHVSCVFGEESMATFLTRAIKNANNVLPDDVRNMQLMEYDGETVVESNFSVIPCTTKDANGLIGLQTDYSKEECLPSWGKIIPAEELLKLEKFLREENVIAVKKENLFLAKAQTNAATKKYMQIGGVFTRHEYRGQGLAAYLVNTIARNSLMDGKKAVLFVRMNNPAAIRAYEKAGFEAFGKYMMCYYKDSKEMQKRP